MNRVEAKAAGLKRFISGVPCPAGHIDERFVSNGSCVVCSMARRDAWRASNGNAEREYRKKYYAENRTESLAKTAQYRAANVEKLREYHGSYRRANAVAISERAKARRAEHPEISRGYCRKWRDKNIEYERARVRAYQIENREEILQKDRARYQAFAERYRAEGRAVYWKDVERNRARNREYHRARAEEMRARWRIWAGDNRDHLRAIRAQRRAAELRATPSWADLDAIAAVYSEARTLELSDGIKRHVDHIVPLQGKTICGLHVAANLQVLHATENLRKANRWSDSDHNHSTSPETV